MALSTTVNWLANFIVAFVTPPIFAAIKGGYYFVIFGIVIISGVIVFFAYPETAHLTLEQLGKAFGEKDEDEERIPASDTGGAWTESTTTVHVEDSAEQDKEEGMVDMGDEKMGDETVEVVTERTVPGDEVLDNEIELDSAHHVIPLSP